jgi:hypothetical protein
MKKLDTKKQNYLPFRIFEKSAKIGTFDLKIYNLG